MKQCKGFSLIELIVVIVLVGIMATGAGMLISRPIDAYNDQLRRQQLVDSAEMALRKISADIRRALPNSIRLVNNSPDSWALEMMNTVDGARYRDEAGGAGFNTANEILDFSLGDSQFNVLGLLRNLTLGNHPALRAVIYNTSPAEIYNDAFNNSNPGIITQEGLTLSVSGNEHHLALDNAFQFEFQSPTQRLFIVDGAISYICNNATGLLTRLDGYVDQLNQIATVAGFPVAANSGRVATQVSSCGIDYQPGTAQRGGLITLDMALTDNANESVRLLHQIHVDNVP